MVELFRHFRLGLGLRDFSDREMSGFVKPPQSSLAVELMKQRALKELGMGPVNPFKECDVMTYYRAKVKAAHPDSNEGNVVTLGSNLQRMREAKDYLIRWLGKNDGEEK